MSQSDSKTLEDATINIQAQPDAKTRRYDRQLRLWAATGQSALESSRILVVSASATSTSILKNLVLPGIGHFTILDQASVTPRDAGNNFFLEGMESVGKNRAEEAVRLLGELNEGVEGVAVKESIEDVLAKKPEWIKEFTLVIAHNQDTKVVGQLSDLLWKGGPPLLVVKSAGFLAEFYIQFNDHAIIESHSDTAPSLRITNPFPTLHEHATTLDFSKLDPTDHGHVPYVVILVRVLEDWKKSHGGNLPKTSAEKKEFKEGIMGMKVKLDEENFDEAEAQAYRCWSEPKIPLDITELFVLPHPAPTSHPTTKQFYTLLSALHKYATSVPPYTLPLSATLPDMRASTQEYIRLQTMYKARALEEKATFVGILKGLEGGDVLAGQGEVVDIFLKNCHALRVLKGEKWGVLDTDQEALVDLLQIYPKAVSTHLALSALSSLPKDIEPTEENIRAAAVNIIGQDAELPQEFDKAAGELVRSPTADIPTTSAFLGGMVAQEAIKMITKQYVPVNGYCVVDLVETWTMVVA